MTRLDARAGAFLGLLLWLSALTAFAQVEFPAPPTEASWETARCSTQDDGSVRCGPVAFKVLVDSLTEAQGEVEKLQLRLGTKDAQLEALKAALLAVPPPVAKQTTTKPILAVVTAVLGTMAISTAIVVDTLQPGARVGLGISGAAAVASSFVIIIF